MNDKEFKGITYEWVQSPHKVELGMWVSESYEERIERELAEFNEQYDEVLDLLAKIASK